MKNRLTALTAVILLAGCAGSSPPAEQASPMSRGAEIWAGTCNRCHELRPPRQFAAGDWPVIVNHMRTKADLTRQQAEAVATYLKRVAEDPS